MFVDGTPVAFDQPSVIGNGRVLVPQRFVTQALGAVVSWNFVTMTVQITSTGATTAPSAAGAPAARTGGPIALRPSRRGMR